MACSSQSDVDAECYKNNSNSDLRSERRSKYNVIIISTVFDCFGGGMGQVTNQIGRLISDKKKTSETSNEMVKAIFKSESITRKHISRIIQEE